MAMFCKEYLIDLNATQACIRAGYSEKTANRIGTENLSKPVIKKDRPLKSHSGEEGRTHSRESIE